MGWFVWSIAAYAVVAVFMLLRAWIGWSPPERVEQVLAVALFLLFAAFDLNVMAGLGGAMEEPHYQRPQTCEDEEGKTHTKPDLSDDEFKALLSKQIEYRRTQAGDQPDFSFRRLNQAHVNELRPAKTGPVKPGDPPPMKGAILAHARLSELDLHDIDFSGANLTCADFTGATLRGAIFDEASLEGAVFQDVEDAEGARFNRITAPGADFSGANLKKSSFDRAVSLAGATFADAKVDDASFAETNLTNALWSPVSAPTPSKIARATGLETLRPVPFGDAKKPSLAGLQLLARELKKAGESSAEDQVTHAYEAAETRQMWAEADISWDGVLTLALAGWRRFTWGALTDYGLSPVRALIALLFVAVTFSPLYWVAIPRDGSRSRWLFRVRPKDALDRTGALRVDAAVSGVGANRWDKRVTRALAASIESTLNVGFGEVKLAEWLGRLRGVEKETTALGWMRVVAGTQSLVATVVFVLWVWCLLGDPFGDAGAG